MKFVIIIGAQKSGTTSLFEYLKQHPSICGSKTKQIDYFTSRWGKKKNWYVSHWKWRKNVHTWALEASPSYTMYPHKSNAAERIDKLEEDVKFIYIVREPVERIKSHYCHMASIGKIEPSMAFSEALRNISCLLDYTKYYSQISAYDKRFGADKSFITTLEKLSKRPSNVLSELCNFLDINNSFNFDFDHRYNTRDTIGAEPKIYNTLKSFVKIRNAYKHLVPLKWRDKIRSCIINDNDRATDINVSSGDKSFIISSLEEEIYGMQQDSRVDVTHWKC